MRRLLLVHGGRPGGRAARLVAAVQAAVLADVSDVTLLVRPALIATAEDLLEAEALLLVTPEHFGYMAGALKDFFDRTFYPVEGKTLGLRVGLIVTAGTDGTGTCRGVERIARGYGWTEVAEPVLLVGELDDAGVHRACELALGLAVGLSVGIY